MDEGNGYCGSGGGMKSVSNAAKIANMVMTGVGMDEICLKKDRVELNIKLSFLQTGWAVWVWW